MIENDLPSAFEKLKSDLSKRNSILWLYNPYISPNTFYDLIEFLPARHKLIFSYLSSRTVIPPSYCVNSDVSQMIMDEIRTEPDELEDE